jgi:hypothetical protein
MRPASLSLVCQLLLALAVPAGAQETPSLSVELNTVEPQAEACRLTFVVENQLGADLDALVFETVLFDTAGQVLTLTLFDFGAVPQSRPRVRQFDLPGSDCASIARVLLNDTHACRGDGLSPDSCTKGLHWSSRTSVEVIG